LIKICPLGVDFDFFKPIQEKHPDVLPNSIIFIGASNNYPKGFNVLVEIIKKMENQKAASNGIGLGSIIFVVFLVLKLANIGVVANWSWWWVLAPVWMPFAFILFVILIMMIGVVLGQKPTVRKRKP
jgi:hypothetical protein